MFTTGQGLLIPRLVEAQRVRSVYGRVQAVAQAGGAIAPLLLGGVLALVSAPVAWVCAAAAYLGSAVAQRRIGPLTPREAPPRSSLWTESGPRIGHLMGHPVLARLTVANALTNASVMAANTLIPVIALRELGMAPSLFAAIGAVAAACGLVGAAVAAQVNERVGLRTTRVAVASGMFIGNALVLGALTARSPVAGHLANSPSSNRRRR